MSTLLDYYKYAKLASAAYVDFDGSIEKFIADANKSRLPEFLGNQMFKGVSPWTMTQEGFHANGPSGFAATLFTNGEEKVLAIRGTEPEGDQFYLDLLEADIAAGPSHSKCITSKMAILHKF